MNINKIRPIAAKRHSVVYTKNFIAGAVSIVASFLFFASPVMADRNEESVATYSIYGSGGISESDAYGTTSEPLLPLEFGKISPWDRSFTSQADEPGAWVFASEAGRVRSNLYSGISSIVGPNYLTSELIWWGNFIHDGQGNPTFTLHESNIAIHAPFPAGLGISDPYTEMDFYVRICNKSLNATEICENQFQFVAKLEGTGGELTQLKNRSGIDVTTEEEPFSDIEPRYEFFAGLDGYMFRFPDTTRELDLWRIGIGGGDEYRLEYRLNLSVVQEFSEHYAQAIFGDLVDAGVGGFTLNTNDSLTESELPCEPDPTRFDNSSDGTVVDSRTGLMWQRCPISYTLNEVNTDDFSDDLCVSDAVNTSDWQTALLSANSDSTANYDDWLLPNVKQLESLVELSCSSATIDSSAFPDTPPTEFWTSTPELNAEQAWQVNFGFGDVIPASKLQKAAVRLVRNSGVNPATPALGLLLNDARVEEGDSGTTSMDFLLTLTRTSTTNVVVDYETKGFTATEGDDYEATSGTVTIPAGEFEASISVMINGDTTIEDSGETLLLTLTNPPSDVYFSRSAALGVIVDDEPRISVNPSVVSQDEGDLGTEGYAFDITLNKPAASLVSIDYTTVDATAVAGDDYVTNSGTAIINIGESSTSVIVIVNGDTIFEDDETFKLVISNPMGATIRGSEIATGIILNDDGGVASYQALNDTGQRHFSRDETYCANATSAMLTCPQAGFPNQDGEFGRDVTNNNDSDGIAGFSFTKMDEDGVVLADQTLTYQFDNSNVDPSRFDIWECIKDEVTGLIWETKTDVPGDLRNYAWTYTWYNGTGVNDGSEPGTENGGTCADTANCDTEKYVAAVNVVGVCGYNDWRLPSIDELYTIGVAGNTAFGAANGLDDEYFPHNYSVNGQATQGYTYWSSNSLATAAQSAWALEFQAPDPLFTNASKSDTRAIRLVRSDNVE